MNPATFSYTVFRAVEPDWLEALDILRKVGIAPNLLDLYTTTDFDLQKKISHVAHVARFEGRKATFFLHPRILDFPRIERIEILLSIALEARKYQVNAKWEQLREWCVRIGCDYSNSIHPRERWRWINALRGADKLPINQLEDDRPKCQYCTKSMPTGSDCHPTREGVHENCGYELDAIMSALREDGLV